MYLIIEENKTLPKESNIKIYKQYNLSKQQKRKYLRLIYIQQSWKRGISKSEEVKE